ncbi:hypothetical protein M9458_009287, partial [Cirrhinus mrigala]
FDHSFVEVYRVKQFRFTPRYQECDSEVDLQESGETGKRFLKPAAAYLPRATGTVMERSFHILPF